MVKTLEKKINMLSKRMALSKESVMREAIKALEEKRKSETEFRKELKAWDMLYAETMRKHNL